MRYAFLLAATLFITAPATSQWVRVDTNSDLPQPFTPAGLVYDGEFLYTLSFQGPPVEVRLVRSADLGASWQAMTAFPTLGGVPDAFLSLGGTLVVSILDGSGAFVHMGVSSDQGVSWTTSELTDIGRPVAYARQGSNWFGTSNLGVVRSTDQGQTWSLLPDSPFSSAIVATEAVLLTSGLTGSFVSTNNGTSWTQVSIDGSSNLFSGMWAWDGSLFIKSGLFATTYRSENGSDWTALDAFSAVGFTSVLAREDSETWVPFAVASGSANFYTSTDLAATAEPIGLEGYPRLDAGTPCFAVPTITQEHVFVAASLCFNEANGIYRYNYATGTATDHHVMPAHFSIGAPYPNPATGRVQVPLELDRTATTSVRILDVLGRELYASQSLRSAGNHVLDLDLTGFAGGLYLVDVRGGGVSETRPIVLKR